jgi:peptidoglycan/xylan/chitin deacetylase (PgdA/CDA1 family)
MLRFDDSWQDEWVNAVPLLEKFNFNATFCVIAAGTTNNGISNQTTNDGLEYMSWQEVDWLYQHGYFVVNHPDSNTQPDINYLSASELYQRVVASQQEFLQHGIKYPKLATDLCMPDGTGMDNASVLDYMYQNGLSHGYAGYLYTTPLTDVQGNPLWSIGITSYNQVQTVWADVDAGGNQSLAYFESLVNQSSSTFAVGITFHHINDHTSQSIYDNITNLENDLAYLKESGFTVVTPPQLPGYLTDYIPPPVPDNDTTTTNSSTSSSVSTSTSSSSTLQSSSTSFSSSTTTMTSSQSATSSLTYSNYSTRILGNGPTASISTSSSLSGESSASSSSQTPSTSFSSSRTQSSHSDSPVIEHSGKNMVTSNNVPIAVIALFSVAIVTTGSLLLVVRKILRQRKLGC